MTILGPDTGSACAMVQWCERASLFARALRALGWTASVVVVTAPRVELNAADCPDALAMPVDARLERAIRRCEATTAATGDKHPLRLRPIRKLQALLLTQFDLVVWADADMTLLPWGNLDATAARWATMAPAVLANASWPRLVSNADTMSPVNGGVFVVRPSTASFAEGLRLLHRCRFNRTHGWDLVGPPRSLGVRFRHVDGTELPESGGDTSDAPLQTDAYKRNDWSFVGADSDQGFLFHLFHVASPRAAQFRWERNQHRAIHWRGSAIVGLPKPWQLPMVAAGLEHRDFGGGGALGFYTRNVESAADARARIAREGRRLQGDPTRGEHRRKKMRGAAVRLEGRSSSAARLPLPSSTPRRGHGRVARESSASRAINTSSYNSWFVSRAYSYLSYSTTGLLSGGDANATPCQRAMWLFRRAAETDPRFHDLPDPGFLSFIPYIALW